MSTITDRTGDGPSAGRISLDHLIALNDEIAALVRAGIPLDRGLLGMKGDLVGRLGAISSRLGERVGRGESLPEALAAEGPGYPRVYRAVVEAGLRGGRLPAALEGLACLARRYAELRKALGLALVYPLMVLTLAYGLFLLFVLFVAPRFLATFATFRLPVHGSIAILSMLGATAIYWAPIVPALLVLVGSWWVRSGGSAALEAGWSGGIIRRIPWLRSVLAATEAANFADLLALLIEQGVPLPEAVDLAGEASGGPSLRRSARNLAEAARRGDSLGESLRTTPDLPPLLRWLMTTGQQQGRLAEALRHAAEMYRRRALDRAELIRIFLPTILLLAIGATATLLFALTLFLPLTSLFQSLAIPS